MRLISGETRPTEVVFLLAFQYNSLFPVSFFPAVGLISVLLSSDFHIEPNHWNIKTSQTWRISPQHNLLLLFPSYLRHAIIKSKDDVVRDSLAFNIVPIGEYGSFDSTYNTGWLT